jgi:hypothetical protein
MTDSSSATFVGREPEMSELVAAHDAAAGGRGRLILIAGEPGIGKSRLADELAARARERGTLVLWGRCWEDAGAPPFWSWIQVLRACLRSQGPEAGRALMGTALRDIAQMLPELRGPGDPEEPATSESARFQLFDSVTTFFRRAAAERPLLVVLDDLHAADTASLLLLRFVGSQLVDIPMLVVGTYRDLELTPDHPLTAAVPELAREPTTRVMALGGLPPAAVGTYIGAAAGFQPPDLLVTAVWRETSGNPLFVGEAIRLLAAEGRLDEVTDLSSLRVAVPAGVRNVILRRVGQAGTAAAELLRLGAMLGPEFRADLLRRLAGPASGDVAAGLDAAVREGLLVPAAGMADGFRFAHDLIRETMEDDIEPAERAALHRRVVAVLEEAFGSSLEDHLGELAHHAFEAVQDGSTGSDEHRELSGRAIDYAVRAGEQAATSLAFEDAARSFGMALSLLARDVVDDAMRRCEVLLRQGEALARAGDIRASRKALLEAADIARRLGSGRHLARAALGIGGRLPWTRPGRDTRLVPLLEDALAALDNEDEALRVRLMIRLACAWRSDASRHEDSDRLSREGVELARRIGDPATLTYALAGRYWATWWPDNLATRRPIADEMVMLAEGLGDPERLIDAHLMRYMTLAEMGDMRGARQEFEEVSRLTDELRQPAHIWLGTAPRTLMTLLEGRLDLAEETLGRELAQKAQLTPARDETSAARFHVFLLRREQDRPAEALDVALAAVAEFPWYPLHRSALALLLIDLGREAEAQAELADLARDGFAIFNRDNEWLLGMCLAAEAAAATGERAAVETLLDLLGPFAGRHAIGQAEGSVGVVDRYLGLLAGAIGDTQGAIDYLRNAVDGNRALGAQPWLAHSLAELADALRAHGGPDAIREADERAAEARAIAARTGMVALARRLGPAAREPRRDVAGQPATFRQEGEYWTVALDGEAVRIRDSRGMRYLARLLAHPGRELHALDLVRGASVVAQAAGRPAGNGDADGLALDADDAGPQLDEAAKRAYRERLTDLDAEVAEAESWNDPERAARAREEIAALAGELSRAVGLGGRDRRAASTSERARVSVTRAIRAAIERVGAQSPTAGEHLDRTVRTGTYCVYAPDPRAPTTWEL